MKDGENRTKPGHFPTLLSSKKACVRVVNGLCIDYIHCPTYFKQKNVIISCIFLPCFEFLLQNDAHILIDSSGHVEYKSSKYALITSLLKSFTTKFRLSLIHEGAILTRCRCKSYSLGGDTSTILPDAVADDVFTNFWFMIISVCKVQVLDTEVGIFVAWGLYCFLM